MPSTLHQKLYLGTLLPGLNMTITDVKASIPSGEKWEVEFNRYDVGSVGISQYGPYDYLSGKYPITVATSTAGGLIGEVTSNGYNGLYSSGTGGKVDITIRIQGTANINGQSYRVDQKGYINVSASDWRGFERPDCSNVSYYWGDTPPFTLSITVPPTIAGMPADAYFALGVSADGKQVGVTTTTHTDILNEVTDYLTRGIFFVNEELGGWAIGEIIF